MNRLVTTSLWIALLVWGGAGAFAEEAPPSRVVSMNPSLTRMLLALGAADRLVGVDEYSATTEPSVEGLPRVGGLFNPSLEAVLALDPDLVVVVPSVSQRDFRSRLGELGVEVLELPNITFDQLLESIETLGDRLDLFDTAHERVETIRAVRREVSKAASKRPRRSALLVLQRDPIYVAGGGSYLNTLLEAVGLDNAAAKYPEAYPRISLEWLIAVAPEVIVDSVADPISAVEHWSRWPSIPAVARGRVVSVEEGIVTLPGPYIDRSLQTLSDAIRSADAASDNLPKAASE